MQIPMSLRRKVDQVVVKEQLVKITKMGESPVLAHTIKITCFMTVLGLPVLCLGRALITYLAFGEDEFTKFIEEIR